MSDAPEERYRRALVERPDDAGALRALAQLLGARGYAAQERGELAAAAECYEEALALDPAQAPVHNNLGNVYQALGRGEEAVAAFRSAIAADDAFAEAHLNLGIALHQAGALEEAAESYRAALRRKPALALANVNLGYLLEQQGDASGAADSYRRAIAAQPDCAEAHFNHALLLLQAGDFARGWDEYEWRLKLPELAPFWPYQDRPRWDGAALNGRRILLYAEQGFGDALQFVRYVPLVAARGGKVILSCPGKLAGLFASAQGVAEMHDAATPPPEFDVCCSLLSLPRLFGTTVQTIPAAVPYLRPRAEAVGHWRRRLGGGGLKVGLFWSTESKNRMTPLRSLELETLAPLASAPGVVFYSLQRGAAAAQAKRPPRGMRLVDLAAELKDFADDAAVLESLDLVITINTSTAHLAGALGRPVWTLVHYPPDWRWLAGRDDTPWYPSMRLFLRAQDESWDDVAARVGAALRAFAGAA
jgi:Tfp pilus assembly protein PilF